MARILKLPSVVERTGKSRSPIYVDIQLGLLPRPVKLGARAVGWPEHEIDQIIAARIAGKSEKDIRALVERLHAERARAAA